MQNLRKFKTHTLLMRGGVELSLIVWSNRLFTERRPPSIWLFLWFQDSGRVVCDIHGRAPPHLSMETSIPSPLYYKLSCHLPGLRHHLSQFSADLQLLVYSGFLGGWCGRSVSISPPAWSLSRRIWKQAGQWQSPEGFLVCRNLNLRHLIFALLVHI